MDSYPEWQQNKLYSDHIRRLVNINRRSSSSKLNKTHKSRLTPNKSLLDDNNSQNATPVIKNHKQKNLQRYKTQPVFKKRQMLRSPIPLVSEDEGKLIKSALNSKHITLKQKQTLLQNYLLSKRILQTKSVIDPNKIKKQFKLHKKTSQNLSQSKRITSSSQERLFTYRKFSKQKQQKAKIEIGEGRNYFQLKIKQILLIKGIVVKNPQILYNLKLYIGKNFYELRALNYQELFDQSIRINFKKSILISNPQITISFSMLRQNHQQQMGAFKPVISNFEKKGSQIYKITKGKFPVGTIDIEGRVVYFANQHRSPSTTKQKTTSG